MLFFITVEDPPISAQDVRDSFSAPLDYFKTMPFNDRWDREYLIRKVWEERRN